MSSDNYYAIRHRDGQWHLTHGFMSCVDDVEDWQENENIVFSNADRGVVLAHYADGVATDGDFMGEWYSEYGLAFIDGEE